MTAAENNTIANNARIDQVKKIVDDASLQGYFQIEVTNNSLIESQTDWLENNGYTVTTNGNMVKISWEIIL
jgi:hypothetical protein